MLVDKPKKYWGQHFLEDSAISERIVAALDIEACSPYTLLEIGPGKGALTKFLISLCLPNLYIIEIDPVLVSYLAKAYPVIKDRIIAGDFLTLDLASRFPTTLKVIGNFPYNISSQIFFRLLAYRSQVQEVVCMVQKEVAERITAPPGSRIYGIPSVLLQAFYNITCLFTVSPAAFTPSPKVQSAVIQLRRNNVVRLPCDESFFFQLVKSSFQQRRKKIKNSLQQLSVDFTKLEKDIVDQRAEQLAVADFIHLTQVLSPKPPGIS
jgi:16S rRNA (adenine1518-N6/adenine1519-N6)-dimethyltransferase